MCCIANLVGLMGVTRLRSMLAEAVIFGAEEPGVQRPHRTLLVEGWAPNEHCCACLVDMAGTACMCGMLVEALFTVTFCGWPMATIQLQGAWLALCPAMLGEGSTRAL